MQLSDIHSLILQRINSGVLIVDADINLVYFNRFMESHSQLKSEDVIGQSLFDTFPDAPEKWLKRKIQSVLMLNSPAFSSWEQRQYVFRMRHARPVTTSSEFMAQDITFIPVCNQQSNEVEQVCIVIDDVTDVFFYQEKLKDTLAKLEQVSRMDGLTQVANRRFWEERFKIEFASAVRHQNPLSLIMFDMDKFKQVNDIYGHQGGDLVLVEATRLVQSMLRKEDLLGRYGGEEFGLILPNTGGKGALELAERIRKAFQVHPMKFKEHVIHATMSVGVCELDNNFKKYEDLVTRADLALYQSKRDGRNRTTLYRK
ncbi:sensor domain-containing diguanylate cyclase [Catenovulum sediminis]|uniref:sensor domain-containing diguanylate cyclase n=1 Tax=Catenovulum sediminis TaxID=1740262 RepID=UPI00117CFB27|nr:diguanylate cyclase [Catenovulum sediminis]